MKCSNCGMPIKWKPIDELNRRESQRVLVAQEGVVKLRFWNHIRQMWETDGWKSNRGADVLPRDECGQPTHWIPLPDAPT